MDARRSLLQVRLYLALLPTPRDGRAEPWWYRGRRQCQRTGHRGPLEPRSLRWRGLVAAVGLALSAGSGAVAETLEATEHQMTFSPALETTPTLGNDGVSDLVVYTSRFDSGSAGNVYYQRFDSTGPLGVPVLVSDSGRDNQLNDISGDFIVYTARDTTTSAANARLYQISTQNNRALSTSGTVDAVRIHENYVAWTEGTSSSRQVMLLDHTGAAAPVAISGAPATIREVEIGDRFVVWEAIGSSRDILAYELATGFGYVVSDQAVIDERKPTTSGAWVAPGN